MINLAITCIGISPLLMSKWSNRGFEGCYPGKHLTFAEQAEGKIYKDTNGTPGIPMIDLRSCLVSAGRFVTFEGRRRVSTATSTRLDSFLHIRDPFLPFPRRVARWVVDKRRGVCFSNHSVIIVHPRFDKWKFTARVEVDAVVATEEMVRNIFDIAGSCIGLGDFRPAKRGPFGRFKVVDWEQVVNVE